ncbi:MAG: cytochrome ubiquinol oxidase subunit I [Candidatus Omnitrophica bacterium]|nr:cytochrome ubiquinol oxidase subunit I [Candidatus Omnitrophota bacterium]
MNYPFWDVPHIGSGWVIGLIAIFHVMISQFAVGGGMYLYFAERKALKEGRRDWLKVIKAHSRFFLILTSVFGTVSGVGIWFAIGLAAPEATSTLIHNFVWGWAIEWVFFMIELSTAAVYYYTWDRIPDKLHLRVGLLYAVSSLFTLIIINGILTFKLTPGNEWLTVAGTGQESNHFWAAFFNPTYWPSLFLRFTVCCSLAGVWALVTCSRIGDESSDLKAELVRWSAKWLMPLFFTMPILLFWFLSQLPESQRGLLELGISNIGRGTFTQVTRTVLVIVMTSVTIVGVVYFFAVRSPKDFSMTHAIAVLLLAFCATFSSEYVREMIRKPYIIVGHMYSNGVRKNAVEKFNKEGYLTHSLWIRSSGDEHLAQGEAMFRGQCMSCHTVDAYRPMKKLLAGRDKESIGNLLKMLHENKSDSPYHKFMPQLVGTPGEIEALRDFLSTFVPKENEHAQVLGH